MIFLTALAFSFCLMIFVALLLTAKEAVSGGDLLMWVTLFLSSTTNGLIMLLMTIEGVFK